MKTTAAVLLALSIVNGPLRSAHPDFSGHWVWDSDRTKAVTGKAPPAGAVR